MADKQELEEQRLEKLKKEKPKKIYYKVKVQAMAPIEIEYRVLAESPEEALELSLRTPPEVRPRVDMGRVRRVKSTVFEYGYVNVKLVKNN